MIQLSNEQARKFLNEEISADEFMQEQMSIEIISAENNSVPFSKVKSIFESLKSKSLSELNTLAASAESQIKRAIAHAQALEGNDSLEDLFVPDGGPLLGGGLDQKAWSEIKEKFGSSVSVLPGSEPAADDVLFVRDNTSIHKLVFEVDI